jgi:hypothetical protein
VIANVSDAANSDCETVECVHSAVSIPPSHNLYVRVMLFIYCQPHIIVLMLQLDFNNTCNINKSVGLVN